MDYLREITLIKVNKTGQIISLHKPILLLLTISEILNNKPNHFLYSEVEESLKILLQKYGLKNSKSLNPQYPFVYLGSSPKLWSCSVKKDQLKNPDSAARNEVLKATAKFDDAFVDYLRETENAKKVVWSILKQYWTEAYHEDILRDLGLENFMNEYSPVGNNDKRRGRKFIEQVLDAYERQCAICRQSIRLGDVLLGIDACHVKPIQHNGPDIVTNGIALCKIHHWALDRGAVGIDSDFTVVVSPKLNGSRSEHFFQDYIGRELFLPRNNLFQLADEHRNYHYEYIFIK